LVGTMTQSGSYHMHCAIWFFNQVKRWEHHCSHVLTIRMYVCMYVPTDLVVANNCFCVGTYVHSQQFTLPTFSPFKTYPLTLVGYLVT
jgi:hypothetical protein